MAATKVASAEDEAVAWVWQLVVRALLRVAKAVTVVRLERSLVLVLALVKLRNLDGVLGKMCACVWVGGESACNHTGCWDPQLQRPARLARSRLQLRRARSRLHQSSGEDIV